MSKGEAARYLIHLVIWLIFGEGLKLSFLRKDQPIYRPDAQSGCQCYYNLE